jgi:hypothetical protein
MATYNHERFVEQEMLREPIKMLEEANAYLGYRFDRLVGADISRRLFHLVFESARDGDSKQARNYARASVADYQPYRNFSVILLVVMLVALMPNFSHLAFSSPKRLVRTIYNL